MGFGAQGGMPSREEVHQFLEKGEDEKR